MEFWAIIGSIAGTALGGLIVYVTSRRSILLNHEHQLKMQKENHEREIEMQKENHERKIEMQKENHEREMKTKAFEETIDKILNSSYSLIHLIKTSPEDDNDLFEKYMTPTEFYLWAKNETLQAVYSFKLAVYKERERLADFDRFDQEQFRAECHKSYFNLVTAEAEVIDCIRREINIPFDKKEYIKIREAYFNQFFDIVGLKSPYKKASNRNMNIERDRD